MRILAILKPSGEVLFQGLTLNEFSFAYNLELARSRGVNAVVLRATAGSNYTDRYFSESANRVQDAGMKLGFYHYLIAESADEARAQARFFCTTIADQAYDFRPAMQFESFGSLSAEQINQIALAFLEETEANCGAAPVVYTYAEAATHLWSAAIAERYPLWLIDPSGGTQPNLESPWTSWVGWQYTATSEARCFVNGIPVSRFTADMLLDAADAGMERKFICLVVAPGDTLSGIARLFDTTVDEIVQLNRIADPNRIYPGQQLYLWVAQSVPYPCCDHYTVKRGDNLSAIGERFGVDWRRLASINQIADPDRIQAGQVIKLGLCSGS